jgi:DNA modification methylase
MPTTNDLNIIYRPIGELKPHPDNARKHSRKQVRALANSVEKFGWTNPILIDDTDTILAGHCRLQAAKYLHLEKVPTLCLSDLDEASRRAYLIADNRLAELGSSWDRQQLASNYESIQLLDPVLDLSVTGFQLDEIEIFLDAATGGNPEQPLPIPAKTTVSRPGDMWFLGEHRLICGDALRSETYARLLGEDRAQLVYVGTPYNVPVNGHMVRRGRHPEFLMASGELSEDEYENFLKTVIANLIRFSQSGSIHYLFIDWRHVAHMLKAVQPYDEMKNIICWNKQTAGLGAFYRSQHEMIVVMKSGTERHINNFRLGENGRHRTNVWSYQGLNSGWDAERQDQLALHPTVQPLEMVVDALKDCSRKRGIVLDPFGGSGTTLMAAEQTDRRACLIELDPVYVDVCIRRWETSTRKSAVHADTGQSFEDTSKEHSA